MQGSTTTIRVSAATHRRLVATRESDFASTSLDQVIDRLLDEHADARLRARFRADAERARRNPEDLAEVRRVQAEMDEISAW